MKQIEIFLIQKFKISQFPIENILLRIPISEDVYSKFPSSGQYSNIIYI